VRIFNPVPVLVALLFIPGASQGQSTDVPFRDNDTIAFEKIYLHTDREFYFLGETIWFKAYLLDGQNLTPVPDVQNLYIDLIGSKGEVLYHQVLLCENGQASGNIMIPDTMETGPFLIRAYTDYLRNFGEEAFFHKPVKISRLKSSFELASERPMLPEGDHQMDISFFPEGGSLLAGVRNLVAFKAIDENGTGIPVKGKVLDNRGKTVEVFKSQYKGMGRMHLNPARGRSYRVELDGYPEFEYSFSDIRNEGVKLQLLGYSAEELVLGIVSNSKKYSRQPFFLACYTRGELLFYRYIEGNMPIKVVIEADVLQGGINRFILLNADYEPLSERLVFSDNINMNRLKVNTDLEEYATRNPVELNILDETDNPGYSSLSVAVVNENALNAGQGGQNILSYLLLDSELKGFIESPADYFVDDSIPSQAKLNLLMLTHGWSRYLRNLFDEKDVPIKYTKTAGITVKGRAERPSGRKSVANGAITMGVIENGNTNWYDSETDPTGRFSFDSLFFIDTAKIVIQALNRRGKQISVFIMDDMSDKPPAVDHDVLCFMKSLPDIPLQLYRQKYLSDLVLREYRPDPATILLEEVEITAEKVEQDDRHTRLYRTPDQVLEVTSQNHSYADVLSFLEGRVPGLFIALDRIYIRGSTSLEREPTPLFLIDGSPLMADESTLNLVRSIPMTTIDKVEILKGNTAAIYGSRAANGIIAIYTKKGSEQDILKDHLQGIISESIVGFSSHREFYSPEYTPENIDSPVPDYRSTLFWDPDITTANGHAFVSFFTGDELSDYRVIVEGIMDNGTICLGSANFAVNRRN
jgi:hypothetical protein